MNKKVLQTLEYHKIIDRLCSFATCDGGRELCRRLMPSCDLHEILTAQAETKDALSRIFKWGSLSFSGVGNVTPGLRHLEIGGVLNASELLSVAALLDAANRAKKYGREDGSDDNGADSLTEYFRQIAPLTSVSQEIRHCILSEDAFADDASAALKKIRRSMSITNERIRSQMTSMLNNSTTRTYLQDGVITMRQGRYCLPVKAEYKSKFPGMVHDQSGTGATFFIEPMSVVNMNNQLRELQLQEAEEIDRILAALSELVAENADAIAADAAVLTRLDFIFAKGMLAKEYNGMAPEFNTKGRIHLRGARHPLLKADTVVPIDLSLGEDFHLLVVTGPNTGGKTVSLKTCGLLTLMGQAGLHIPAKDRSCLSVFEEIFADIGDEQSIEQSLSTFSSHMKNIVNILNQVDRRPDPSRYLVLFDELCAGTDPAEGAALATAILTHLHELRVPTMATTHYSELKLYALSTPDVENASLEFDVERLSPTYRLLIGVPGKSNAFAISQKLGLSPKTIDVAREQLGARDRSFEDLFIDLEEKRHAMEEDRLQIQRDRESIAAMRAAMDERQRRLEESREKILYNANEEAGQILREAKEMADETIRNFNKYGKGQPDMAAMERQRGKVGDALSKTQRKTALKQTSSAHHQPPRKVSVGDDVKVLSMNLKGTVLTLPNAKGDLQVQMGIMRSKVNIKDLELLEEKDTAKNKKYGKTSGGGMGLGKAASISPEIQLLGLTADEAISRLDKYLDDACLSHLSQVRVVHGKGSGVLRKAVHEYLRKHKQIRSYRLAEFGEGDSGVTIVEL